MRFFGQHRFDGDSLIIGEFVAHDTKLLVWELESQASGKTNAPGLGSASAFSGKAEIV